MTSPARLAQSVEHQTFNLRVMGSSPISGGTSTCFFLAQSSLLAQGKIAPGFRRARRPKVEQTTLKYRRPEENSKTNLQGKTARKKVSQAMRFDWLFSCLSYFLGQTHR